jgi:para-aminobenzoate synthetase component 1
MNTTLANLNPLTAALKLRQQKGFVWLDSAVGGNCSLLACLPEETNVFQDTTELATFLKTISPISSEHLWLSAFSYEAFSAFEQFPKKNLPTKNTAPLAVLAKYPAYLLFDHQTQSFELHAETAIAKQALLKCLKLEVSPLENFHVLEEPKPAISFARYQEDVKAIKEAINRGDVYEVNYTFDWLARYKGDAFSAYLKLRQTVPAPFMAYMQIPGGAILSASPERFFETRGASIILNPIKGTIQRASDTSQDGINQKILLQSPKDDAELLMIVDLLRNDLGRVCEFGSVTVPNRKRLMSFSHYHHLVADICGKLKAKTTAYDLFNALFPGGSITGAPKIMAMDMIKKLESRSRGFYTGAMGYFGPNGCCFNIPIRTVLLQESGQLNFATGGGIVADSDIQAEYEECLTKAAGILEAFKKYI